MAALSAVAVIVSALVPVPAAQAAPQGKDRTYFAAADGQDVGGCEVRHACSLERAQELVRHEARKGRDVTVLLEDGTYRLSEPLTFGPQDGGRDGHTVRWTAAPGAHPVVIRRRADLRVVGPRRGGRRLRRGHAARRRQPPALRERDHRAARRPAAGQLRRHADPDRPDRQQRAARLPERPAGPGADRVPVARRLHQPLLPRRVDRRLDDHHGAAGLGQQHLGLGHRAELVPGRAHVVAGELPRVPRRRRRVVPRPVRGQAVLQARRRRRPRRPGRRAPAGGVAGEHQRHVRRARDGPRVRRHRVHRHLLAGPVHARLRDPAERRVHQGRVRLPPGRRLHAAAPAAARCSNEPASTPGTRSRRRCRSPRPRTSP